MFPPSPADKNMGGIEKSMREQAWDKVTTQLDPLVGWFNWAERHPGIVLLGALAVALLALRESPKSGNTEHDTRGEDVPLFI